MDDHEAITGHCKTEEWDFTYDQLEDTFPRCSRGTMHRWISTSGDWDLILQRIKPVLKPRDWTARLAPAKENEFEP